MSKSTPFDSLYYVTKERVDNVLELEKKIESKKLEVMENYSAIDSGGGGDYTDYVPQHHISGQDKAERLNERRNHWEQSCKELDKVYSEWLDTMLLLDCLFRTNKQLPLHFLYFRYWSFMPEDLRYKYEDFKYETKKIKIREMVCRGYILYNGLKKDTDKYTYHVKRLKKFTCLREYLNHRYFLHIPFGNKDEKSSLPLSKNDGRKE